MIEELASAGAGRAMVATALAAGASTVTIGAEEATPAAGNMPHAGAPSHPRRVVHVSRSMRRRRPARLVRGALPRKAVADTTVAALPAEPPATTDAELRDWIKENATLLSNASLLISISALALNVLPTSGFLNPYIKALIFGAALLLLLELHHQWPDELQLLQMRSVTLPRQHSWRMSAFAMLLQIATAMFVLWVALNNPIILLPLTAIAIVVAFRTWYFRRFRGTLARIAGILALVVVLVLGELVMLAVWARIANEKITIEIGSSQGTIFKVGP